MRKGFCGKVCGGGGYAFRGLYSRISVFVSTRYKSEQSAIKVRFMGVLRTFGAAGMSDS